MVVLTVSADLPFAQGRWCGAAGISNVKTLSDHFDMNFANAYGRTASDGNSAFFVIDIQDIPGARQKLADVGLQILADEAVYSG